MTKKISACPWTEYKTNLNLENAIGAAGDWPADPDLSQKIALLSEM
jgi:hypothetical protein